MGHPYRGQSAVLATKHGKLPLVAPPLEDQVGLAVVDCDVDTDVFGTFAGDVPRTLTMGEAAIAKARLGMQRTGLTLGLGSEGTIGPDPVTGMLTCDVELLTLVDDAQGIVITEVVRDFEIVAISQAVSPGDSLDALRTAADFPQHALIVRPEAVAVPELLPELLVKGVGTDVDAAELDAAIRRCAQASPSGKARVESDFRAHCSPSRQRIIRATAQALARRIARRCPNCATPGWGQIDLLRGLPCAACGAWVARARWGVVLGCVRCDHTLEVSDGRTTEDPVRCNICNP
ncbi:MAG: DUF6671 family protein [Actinomycetales bacterium]